MVSTTDYIWYWHGYRDRAAGMPNTSHVVPISHRRDYDKGWVDGSDAPPRREIPYTERT